MNKPYYGDCLTVMQEYLDNTKKKTDIILESVRNNSYNNLVCDLQYMEI